ncbi:hypothetical protein CHLNCDRAFT_143768 [Chlorella variabilis]|uniref:Uncharacterized protein n=1 Tax=Chlorella variabilis TaxID=554065 RepID=E1ZAE5_CHLVA|nr:hypothetical protein CHLNCDRAFT_143768 [Chlorella variabilis]EFN57246.1 hypothetical protein CHLNCDRAFT_143768 [Chlorella variabilis]|eukprot:XP_005849348.1 hypothetical protein CHLNCDRAFT_143768 [Chlorella variabilis]
MLCRLEEHPALPVASGAEAAPDQLYEEELHQRGPLTPQQGSPAARAGPSPSATRVELPCGSTICLPLDHDGSAPRVVHHACKLLLRSPQDQVVLLHVAQKGHPQGSGTLSQRISGTSSAGTLSLGDSEHHVTAPAGSWATPVAAPPAPPEAGGEPGSRLASSSGLGGLGSPAGGSLDAGSQWGSGGSFSQLRSPRHHQRDEGCTELLERCRQQLLAESKRVHPSNVSLQLMLARRSPEKAILAIEVDAVLSAAGISDDREGMAAIARASNAKLAASHDRLAAHSRGDGGMAEQAAQHEPQGLQSGTSLAPHSVQQLCRRSGPRRCLGASTGGSSDGGSPPEPPMAGEPEPGGGTGVPLAQRAATLVATLAHSLAAAIDMAPAVLPWVLPWVLAIYVWQALAGPLAAKPAVLLGAAVVLLGALLLAAMLWIMWATFGVLQRSLTFDAAFAAQVAALQASSPLEAAREAVAEQVYSRQTRFRQEAWEAWSAKFKYSKLVGDLTDRGGSGGSGTATWRS